MRKLVCILLFVLAGCANSMYAFGDSYHSSCEGKMTYVAGEESEVASLTCDGKWIEHAGGQLSQQAAGMLSGMVSGIRNAALAACGVPVP